MEKNQEGRLHLVGKAYVDSGEFSQEVAHTRFNIFKKEMALALKRITFGDLPFYNNYPVLLDASIFIYFESSYPQYRQVVFYGTPRLYLTQIYDSLDQEVAIHQQAQVHCQLGSGVLVLSLSG
ncbi:staygreen family protein [Alkalihalobacterium alkalinitrilicum]|uniref:staygreen family protein n=1 Tax=Alkalihalobacterium alkalinitrilicum TaxID=427920 RepID=UPI001EE4CAF5|nr:staygreen family protein [Alkalihalobacterium alkalinitrilicum]